MNGLLQQKWFGKFKFVVFVGLIEFLLLTAGQNSPFLAAEEKTAEEKSGKEKPGNKPKTGYPQIVKTVPEIGATDVPVNTKEIRVTFDRNMGGGMSWTGGKPFYPPTDSSKKARWVDQRTCVLPVKLERGNFYRVGINSTSFQNFKSSDGVPAHSSVIYFVTVGADKSVKERVQVPKIVKLEPADGALNVDSSIQSISVTFDIKMGTGMSWTKAGAAFPKSPPGTTPVWSEDGKTCTFPVALNAGHQYQLGLNNTHHNNFQSEWGVPLDPVSYSFKTK